MQDRLVPFCTKAINYCALLPASWTPVSHLFFLLHLSPLIFRSTSAHPDQGRRPKNCFCSKQPHQTPRVKDSRKEKKNCRLPSHTDVHIVQCNGRRWRRSKDGQQCRPSRSESLIQSGPGQFDTGYYYYNYYYYYDFYYYYWSRTIWHRMHQQRPMNGAGEWMNKIKAQCRILWMDELDWKYICSPFFLHFLKVAALSVYGGDEVFPHNIWFFSSSFSPKSQYGLFWIKQIYRDNVQ